MLDRCTEIIIIKKWDERQNKRKTRTPKHPHIPREVSPFVI
jgi:hypothetical protein